MNLTATQQMALLKTISDKQAKVAREELTPGSYEVDFTVHIKGTMEVAADGNKTATCSVPLMETMAFLIRRMGITREAAKTALVAAMKDAIMETNKGEGSILLAHPEIAESLEQVKELMKDLPKTPTKGAVRAKLSLIPSEA